MGFISQDAARFDLENLHLQHGAKIYSKSPEKTQNIWTRGERDMHESTNTNDKTDPNQSLEAVVSAVQGNAI